LTAHLNLRDEYLPYKNLIATVIMDKNPTIKTVINKLDDVGAENKFRTFPLEIIAGHKDLNVVAKEYNCEFRFNYADVYWNSRLSTEHARLIAKFQKGEVVCDAMAGVGPFAVPAGKDKVFVWANDLNPHSYEGLNDAIVRNKVGQFVRASNQDARTFIEKTAGQLLTASPREVVIREKVHRRPSDPNAPRPPGKILDTITQPRTFSHYVMNLPASATAFLDAFIGLYAGHERLFQPHTKTKLPMVHVYCFSTKSDDDGPEKIKICEEISSRIEHRIVPEDPEVEIWNVRNVAPNKVMFCASFRLPGEVAFRREVRS
jgi:tRNA (guanine37-N1)-methyltransferase